MVKICGFTQEENLRQCLKFPIDAYGFIASENSPRFISAEKLKTFIKLIPQDKKKVAVFVDPTEKIVNSYLEIGVNCLQFHGDEKAKFIKKFTAFEVWKAFRLNSQEQFKDLEKYKFIDYFLIDGFSSGKLAPWDLVKRIIKKYPAKKIILAGGISQHNIKKAKKTFPELYGFDLSSSVEKTKGIKDPKKLQLFFSAYH